MEINALYTFLLMIIPPIYCMKNLNYRKPSFRYDYAEAGMIVDKSKKLAQYPHLVVPVVGCNFRPTLSDLASLIGQAKREDKRRALVEELEGYKERIRQYLETLRMYISSEPYNPHDPHALAIIIEDKTQRRLLGYLKRELAAMLSPSLPKATPSTPSLARLSPHRADVEIWI